MWRRAKQMTGSLCFPGLFECDWFFFFLKCVTLEEVVPPKPRSAPESKLMSARPLLPQTSPIARHPGKRTTTNLVFMIGDTEKKTIFIPVRQFYVTSGWLGRAVGMINGVVVGSLLLINESNRRELVRALRVLLFPQHVRTIFQE